MHLLKRILPIIISGVLIAIMIGYAPWPQVGAALRRLDPVAYIALFGLSLLYYALKMIRFWAMTRALGIQTSLGITSLSYMAAQPVTLLPGGEVYRSRMLERLAGVPMSKSLPNFTMQGLLEGAAMAIVGVACALTLRELQLVNIILAVSVAAAFLVIRMGALPKLLAWLNQLPFVSFSRAKINKFSKGHETLLSRKVLPTLLALSIGIELVGGLIAYATVQGLHGHINILEGMLAYIVPTLAGFVSFVPGGFGVSEQSTVGFLLLAHNTLAVAVAATLLIRMAIVGTGFIYGCLAWGVAKFVEGSKK